MHTSHYYCNNRSKQANERESKPISNNKKRQVHDREKEYDEVGVIEYKRRNEQTLD